MENTDTMTPTAPAAPFVIDNEGGANWLLAKLAAIDSEHERVAVQAARRRAELQADRERLLHQFGEQLTAFARAEAETRRRKTVTLLQGSIAFRSVPARFVVVDEAQAIEAARESCPAALAVATVTRLDRNALLDYVKETGDVLPGVELIAASESVSIKPGAKASE